MLVPNRLTGRFPDEERNGNEEFTQKMTKAVTDLKAQLVVERAKN